mgnify:CR=1 FL=1
MSFEEKIKSWVSFDNQIKILNERARSLREERSKLAKDIFHYVETQNLSNATVQISDGRLKFGDTLQSTPLTLTFVKKCLSECIKNNDTVDAIMNYIKTSRNKKSIPEIKRTYTNNKE